MSNSIQNFVARATAGVARVERGFYKLLSPLASINRMLAGLGYYVGLFSLVLLLRNAIGVMADFQQANITLSTVIDKESLPMMGALASEARRVAVQYGLVATEIVKVQTALAKMGFTGVDIKEMTAPIALGAVALQTTPERMAETTAAILLSFQKNATETKDVINKLAFAANKTAADFESYATQLPIVARVAYISGQSYEKVLAYLGTLRNVQIHTSTGATSLKNIIIDAAVKHKEFRKAIEQVAASQNAVVYAYNKYGKRSVVSALEFAKQLNYIDKLVKDIENAPKNYVEQLAGMQLNSFKGAVKLAKSAWDEFIFSIDDGRGPFAKSLTDLTLTAGAVLLLAAGSKEALSELARLRPDIVETAHKWLFWAKAIIVVTSVILLTSVALKIWRVGLLLTTVATVGLNFALGILAGLFGLTSVWIGTSLATVRGYIIATNLVTAATWLWNAALAANPIVWVIVAIIALVSWVAILVKKWDDWGAAMSYTLGPIGALLSLFVAIQNNWEKIKMAFSEKGLIAGIKQIGITIIESILYPMQQISQWIYKITGIEAYNNAAKQIMLFRKVLDAEGPEQGSPDKKPTVNLDERRQQVQRDSLMQVMTQKSAVEIVDKTGSKFGVFSNNDDVKIRVDSTMNYNWAHD